MSYAKKRSFFDALRSTRSLKSLVMHFLKDTFAGQKIFLYNERIPRVINISFNEQTCMFACRICPYAEQSVRDLYKERSEMTFPTLEKLVESVPNDPYYTFDISAIGETLMFKRLPEFIAHMKKRRPLVNTTISTNALPLTEKMFLALAESGLDTIQFSFFAGNKEDHRYITGSDSFERVADNIRMASRLKKLHGLEKPFIQLFMIESRETRDKAAQFLEEWSPYADKAFVRPMYNLGREIDGMTPIETDALPSTRYPCIMPWYSTAIRSTGDVLPCYMYHWRPESKDLAIGNINAQTLEEIWRSQWFSDFREAHRKVELESYPICKDCNLWAAYTDIWTRQPDGSYRVDPPRLAEFVRPVSSYRGG